MPRQLYQLILLLLLLALSRCAQMAPLTGGERDTKPPALVGSTPANGSTSFTQSAIALRFDEFVQLKDLNNQLMVSPRLKTSPEISAEGKSIVVRFKKEELTPNTTYRVDFGNAIADMNESNSIQGFNFVFSTGPLIDTLRLSGAVSTASNNQPFSGALIALYRQAGPELSDSVPLRTPPDYSTRSGAGGGYRFVNLPAGNYRLYAIHDNNRNNVYDGEAEKIAFRSEVLRLSKDTGVTLKLFTEEPRRLFVKRVFSPFYGMAHVIFNKKVYSTVTALDRDKRPFFYEADAGKEKDTVTVFYHSVSDTLSLVLEHPEHMQSDTVHIALPEKRINRKRLRAMHANPSGGVLPVSQELRIVFPVWMDTTSLKRERLKIRSADDSLIATTQPRLGWIDIRTMKVTAAWKEGASYTLKADTGLVYDLQGVSNDTMPLSFRRQSSTDLAKLTLNIVFSRKQAYVVQLLNLSDQVIQQRSFALALASSNSVKLGFDGLPPGSYKAKIIYDDNANGRWDTGKLLSKTQPEKVIVHTKEIKLLADWEVEEELQVKE